MRPGHLRVGRGEERLGGAHKDMKKPAGDGKDSHHIPDRGADPSVNPEDGMAIKMDPEDHRETSSWGRSKIAQEYREETKQMIEQGRKRDAVARDVRDARNAAYEGSGNLRKYNQGLQQMLNYGKKTGQIPSKK